MSKPGNHKILERTERELLLSALEEKQRRDKKKRPPFKPNPGQLAVLQSKKLIRVVTSGNGAGKTTMACVEAVWTCQGYNPITLEYTKVPNKVIYVLDRPAKVNDKIVPEIKKFFDTTEWQFHKDGTPTFRRISLPNGSEIIFMFHEMEAMAFESIDGYSKVVYDEPCARFVFVALLRGGRSKGHNTTHLFVGTPIGANSSWMRTDLLERWKNGDKDIDVFNFSTDENKANLDWERVEANFKFLSEKEVEIRRHGQWSDLEGLALAHLWDDSVHIAKGVEWNEEWPCVVAVDPHPSKAHMAILVGCDPHDRLYVLKEMTEKLTPRDFAKKLKLFIKGYRVIDIVIDNLGSADTTGGEGFMSFIEVMRDEGLRVRPTSYDEKVDAEWITRLQESLQIPDQPDNFGTKLPKLRFAPSARICISDVKNVQWVKMRNVSEYRPTLEISNKDGLACIKYALATGLHYAKPRKIEPHFVKGRIYGVTGDAKERHRSRMSLRMKRKRRNAIISSDDSDW